MADFSLALFIFAIFNLLTNSAIQHVWGQLCLLIRAKYPDQPVWIAGVLKPQPADTIKAITDEGLVTRYHLTLGFDKLTEQCKAIVAELQRQEELRGEPDPPVPACQCSGGEAYILLLQWTLKHPNQRSLPNLTFRR